MSFRTKEHRSTQTQQRTRHGTNVPSADWWLWINPRRLQCCTLFLARLCSIGMNLKAPPSLTHSFTDHLTSPCSCLASTTCKPTTVIVPITRQLLHFGPCSVVFYAVVSQCCTQSGRVLVLKYLAPPSTTLRTTNRRSI